MKLSLLQALLETINEEWSSQSADIHGEYYNVLTIAYVHPELAKSIEREGNIFPKEFDPNTFNGEENYTTVEIRICTGQDGLIYYKYE